MKSVFIKTVVGKDKPNIVKSMAEVTRGLGGEWVKSKIIHLGSQFSAMMMVSIDQEKEAELKTSLEKKFPDLLFSYSATAEPSTEAPAAVTVVLDCKDRPGLTHDITKTLSELGLKAGNMEFHRLPVVPVGHTVFNAKMTIRFDGEASKEEFVETLESICDDARVSFE